MDRRKINYVTRLLTELNGLEDGEEKVKLRNKIYMHLHPFMKRWVRSNLSKYAQVDSAQEIVSLCWECFEFCVSYYKPGSEIPVPEHFHKYSGFYLKKRYSVKQTPEVAPYDMIIEKPFEEADISIRAFLNMLQELCESLPRDYQIIFEDALHSMNPGNKTKKRRVHMVDMQPRFYDESKKVMKMFIIFLYNYHVRGKH